MQSTAQLSVKNMVQSQKDMERSCEMVSGQKKRTQKLHVIAEHGKRQLTHPSKR